MKYLKEPKFHKKRVIYRSLPKQIWKLEGDSITTYWLKKVKKANKTAIVYESEDGNTIIDTGFTNESKTAENQALTLINTNI